MSPDKVKTLKPLDRLLYWITERDSIRLKRAADEPAPWTDDPIFQRYRFCNVRRMDDRVSRWLMDRWYRPHKDHPNMLAAVALARFINLPSSLEHLDKWVFRDGPPNWDRVKQELRTRKPLGPVFNGAYMVRGNSTKSPDKIGTVVDEYVASLTRPGVAVDTSSMERTHERLVLFTYGFGSFMAGQVVADLRWAMTGRWADRNTWAPVGPGSARGLARVLYGDEWQTVARGYVGKPADWLYDFLPLVNKLRKGLSVKIATRLEAHDFQNCLCEFDKYERALWGEGRPKQLYAGGGT